MRDCYFIVADADMEHIVRGMLQRPRFDLALGCGSFVFEPSLDVLRAVGDNDPGLYQRIESYVRPVRESHRYLAVLIDAEWSGSPGAARIRADILDACHRSGWPEGDAVAVVMDPELEVWIWQDNPTVEKAVGHQGSSLRAALALSGVWPEGSPKPPRPKEALEAVLRRNRVPRSSALYRRVAGQISVNACTDAAFVELRSALRRWFPPPVSWSSQHVE
jgi:hypothetical protein